MDKWVYLLRVKRIMYWVCEDEENRENDVYED